VSPLEKLAGLIAVRVIFSFAAAAVLAEGALHPLRRRHSSDTAILVRGIAQFTSATACKVSLRAADGVSLDGWWLVPARKNGRAVMVCHGVADSRIWRSRIRTAVLEERICSSPAGEPGHGASGGFVTYGVLKCELFLL
jgi:hypothetical protein